MAKRLCKAPEIKIHLLLVQVIVGSFKCSLAVAMGLVAVARDLLVSQALTLASKMFGESVGIVLHKLAKRPFSEYAAAFTQGIIK